MQTGLLRQRRLYCDTGADRLCLGAIIAYMTADAAITGATHVAVADPVGWGRYAFALCVFYRPPGVKRTHAACRHEGAGYAPLCPYLGQNKFTPPRKLAF